ncbi:MULTISPECIES: hypothetical protein [unclassified Nocardioides]|uniref:hypothetical protein n=1 Tax=unclassified Nocardioides TaxID=2615069 RepID=UPI000A9BEE2E|nr:MULTISPECIES: hypothetical protein [unclassified Nocardioides]
MSDLDQPTLACPVGHATLLTGTYCTECAAVLVHVEVFEGVPIAERVQRVSRRRLLLAGAITLAAVGALTLGALLIGQNPDPEPRKAQLQTPSVSDTTVPQHARKDRVQDNQIIEGAEDDDLSPKLNDDEAQVEKVPGDSTGVGYGGVEIGMSLDDLLASGEVTKMDPNPGCADRGDCDAPCESYGLAGGGRADMASGGNVVGQIVFENDMATSKGIRIGASEKDLLAAYPEAAANETPYPDNTEYVVPIRAGVNYFAYVTSGQVSHLFMSRETTICMS